MQLKIKYLIMLDLSILIMFIMNPLKTKGMFNNNYIELESKSDICKNLSLAGYVGKTCLYLKNLVLELKDTTDTCYN